MIDDKGRPRTTRKLNRIKDLYWYIKKNSPITSREIAEEFGMSIRTVQRDLDVLEYNELVFCSKRGTWHVTSRKVKGS